MIIKDPHIIYLFFSSYYYILKFFFGFPLSFWTFTHYSHNCDYLDTYADWVPGWMPASCQKGGLGWGQPYNFYTVWRELGNEDDQTEKADWWQRQTDWLAAVGVAGHECAACSYIAHIQIVWLDFLSHYFISSAYYSKRNSQIKCGSLMIMHPHCTFTSHAHAYASDTITRQKQIVVSANFRVFLCVTSH